MTAGEEQELSFTLESEDIINALLEKGLNALLAEAGQHPPFGKPDLEQFANPFPPEPENEQVSTLLHRKGWLTTPQHIECALRGNTGVGHHHSGGRRQ
jgi:hypothetical protein